MQVTKDFLKESNLLRSARQLLFSDPLQKLQISLCIQLDPVGQKAIVEAASFLWDQLLQCLGQIGEIDRDDPFAALLKIINTGNRILKDMIRLYLLQSPAFYNQAILETLCESGPAVSLGIAEDAALRIRNKKLRVGIFLLRSIG